MEFFWITLSVAIFVLQKGSHARDAELLKSNSEGFCPSGWHSFGEFCFKGFSEKRTFENAEKECVKQGGHLAAILSQGMQDFLTAKVLLSLSQKSYIGLEHNASIDKSFWTNGSEVEFTAWDANEPSRKTQKDTDEKCVEMTYNEVLGRLGKWNDIRCNLKLSYICQKLKVPGAERPKKEPNQCSHTTDGVGFINSCFHLSLHLKTWDEAEKYCMEQYNGHLATITDAAVQKFLHYEVENDNAAHNSLWIGIKLKPDEIALWSSGWYLAYSNWEHKEGNEKISPLSCAAMTKDTGGWMLDSCDKQLPFICENSSVIPPGKLKPTTPGLKCPYEEWIDLGGDYCYIFGKKASVSWHHANFLCMKKGGTLVSIHSKQEQDVLGQFFRLVPSGVHIGLFRPDYDPERAFHWVDSSPLDYVNWRYGEPNDKNEICGEAMPFQNMLWNDRNCGSSGMFICSVPKNASSNGTEEMPCHTEREECKCLPPAAVAGVVLCALFAIALLGIVVYNVKPWMRARQKNRKRQSSSASERPQSRRGEIVISEQIYENMNREYYDNTNLYEDTNISAGTASIP